MKAMAINRYGGPEVLEQMDLPTPKIGMDGILVRVKAAGVNPVDWKIRQGYLDAAFPSHFPLVPGWDVAGVVESVGPAVTAYAPGDEVIGYVRRDHIQHGTYAQLVPAPERALAHKPPGLDWAQAAALPLVALTAYQALKAANVASGETVLVNAAAGGVGHVAVQLARLLGAIRVIGTASEGNHDFVRQLGAEPVAYGEGMVERVRQLAPEGVDMALDAVGGDAIEASASLVKQADRLVSITDAAAVKRLGGRYVFVRPDPADLAVLAAYAEGGQLKLHIERTFPLADAAEAQRLVQRGHVRGKVVLLVD
ncbi:MAG: NADP-dependent oxidoreductase [Micromonosporaceae bacterium]|nr:NADP-dependent oxidoreductase [Micromonosporaceae bacterium]